MALISPPDAIEVGEQARGIRERTRSGRY